jgi:hypothetical protein
MALGFAIDLLKITLAMLIFSVPLGFGGMALALWSLTFFLRQEVLQLTPQAIKLSTNLGGFLHWDRQIRLPELFSIEQEPGHFPVQTTVAMVLTDTADRRYRFGQMMSLSERAWLKDEIFAYLTRYCSAAQLASLQAQDQEAETFPGAEAAPITLGIEGHLGELVNQAMNQAIHQALDQAGISRKTTHSGHHSGIQISVTRTSINHVQQVQKVQIKDPSQPVIHVSGNIADGSNVESAGLRPDALREMAGRVLQQHPDSDFEEFRRAFEASYAIGMHPETLQALQALFAELRKQMFDQRS